MKVKPLGVRQSFSDASEQVAHCIWSKKKNDPFGGKPVHLDASKVEPVKIREGVEATAKRHSTRGRGAKRVVVVRIQRRVVIEVLEQRVRNNNKMENGLTRATSWTWITSYANLAISCPIIAVLLVLSPDSPIGVR